jgi:hypothetical protein
MTILIHRKDAKNAKAIHHRGHKEHKEIHRKEREGWTPPCSLRTIQFAEQQVTMTTLEVS